MLKVIKKEFTMILEFWLFIPIVLFLISIFSAIPIGIMGHYGLIDEPKKLMLLIYLHQLGMCFVFYLYFALGYLISKKVRNIYDYNITLVNDKAYFDYTSNEENCSFTHDNNIFFDDYEQAIAGIEPYKSMYGFE